MSSSASAFRLTRSPPPLALSLASMTFADPTTLSPPDQPTQTGQPRTFSFKGNTGNHAGDGRIINAGGDQAMTANDDAPANSPCLGDPRMDHDDAVALSTSSNPCDDGNCEQVDHPADYMLTRRWYPTLAVRTYTASAATMLLPLTPENNYEATVLFCGGSNIAVDAWNPAANVIIDIPADSACVRISPDADAKWEDDTSVPEGRTMGNFILLPDGTILLLNGGGMGTAGYGTQDWTVGESYATAPIHAPLIYHPSNRTFSRVGLGNSTIDRLYHSTACCSLTARELFFPCYYFERRPEPAGLLSQLSYGGAYFDVTLSSDDMNGDPVTHASQTTAVLIRTGFSTHGLNMGQRYLELNSTYTVNLDGTVTLHVSQLPANANLFPPGPVAIHIVVAGVPSVGNLIMVGSGRIETQALLAVTPLLPSGVQANDTQTNSTGDGGNGGGGPSVHASLALGLGASATFALASLLIVAGLSFTV
ncbi:DUF1929-domain-containing protein [Clavulina sp. PMI_390]|nr:DUF1929-domain-containing protein [Clavulina sp. PMI_390]